VKAEPAHPARLGFANSVAPPQNGPAIMGIVAVVGASEKPERYSNRALRMLLSRGLTPIPISKSGKDILGLKGYAALTALPGPIDTVTVYLSPEKQAPVVQDILTVMPRRVIFNPGAENPQAAETLARRGIMVVEACTLVLLTTGQF
jgi:uncharacterized protein